MSILSATMVCTALLGAGPDVITSEHTETANQTGQKVVQIHCQETASCATTTVSCGASGCQTACNTGCQTACNNGCPPACNTGCQSACNNGCCENGCCNNCCKNGCQSGCKNGCKWCPWGGGDDCDDDCDLCCCERHILTYCVGPGDMYPHYPYFPAYHGYYYFRPYNHDHVVPASLLAAEMGGEPLAPYSVAFLKDVFPPAPIEAIPENVQRKLPLLEDLLTPKKAYTE